MEVLDALAILREKAKKDPAVRAELLKSAADKNPVMQFCIAAEKFGAPMDEMDLVFEGEEDYAAIRRSTNGGGENSPLLYGSDDYYSMFIAELRDME